MHTRRRRFHGISWLSALILLGSLAFMACQNPTSSGNTASSAKAITAFAFVSPAVTGTISGTAIAVTVPYGTDVTKLVAAFTTTGASVVVGTTTQVSGTTANNFTGPVTYTVSAADGSTSSYTVTVTVAPASTNAALSTLTVSTGTLTPSFSASTSSYTVSVANSVTSITVGATAADSTASVSISPSQPSSLSVGNNTITVTVTAQSGVTNTYTVTVTRAALVSFNANGGSGTMTSQTGAPGTAVTLTANAFTYTGYSFAGWNSKADGSGTTYADKASFTMGSSNVTLYAQWSNQTAISITPPGQLASYSVSIATSTSSTTLHYGTAITFTGTYTGNPTAYQWYQDGAKVSGAMSASWILTPTVSTLTYGQHLVSLVITDANGLTYNGNLMVTVTN